MTYKESTMPKNLKEPEEEEEELNILNTLITYYMIVEGYYKFFFMNL